MNSIDQILLEALLQVEFEIGRSQKIFEKENLFFSTQITPFHSYDLFEVIIKAFPIPNENYEFLYDILENLLENKISVKECLHQINHLF